MYTRQSRNASLKFKSPKKLVAGKFHSRTEISSRDVEEKKETKAVVKKMSLDDLKNQLSAWVENEHIPGKMQSWFVKDCDVNNFDWRFIIKKTGEHESLVIEGPSKNAEPPEVVTRISEQIHKDHLRSLRKSIRQIWFRATGNGRFALLVQANCHGKNSAHGFKLFSEFVERSCPEVISCHQIQCSPDHLFNPSTKVSMKVDCKNGFGKDLMPIGDTGFYMHVLDWAPRHKDTWLALPERIKDAIHPARGDKFFDFYSGASFVGASLASFFDKVESLDCRESAMVSSRYNSRSLVNENLRFHRGFLENSFITKFFSKEENEGRWTFYFNLPEGESLPQGIEQAAAASRPERILLQSSDLEIASKEIKHFRREGYVLRKSIPLYMDPDSGKFELLMLFVPDRAGLLSQKMPPKGASRSIQRPKERVNEGNSSNIRRFITDVPTFKQRKG